IRAYGSGMTSQYAPTALDTSPPRAGTRDWIGMAVLVLPALLVSMDLSVLFMAAPWISAELAPTATQQLWVMDIYGFVMAGCSSPWAPSATGSGDAGCS